MFFMVILLLCVPSTSTQSHPPLTYACRTAKKAECNKLHFVPGHNLLGEGLDIVTMKKTRAYLVNLQKYETPDETCTVCNNPYMNKSWQKVPLGVVDWKPLSYCERKISSGVSQTATSLAEESASNVEKNWEAGLELNHKLANAKLVLAGSQSQLAQFAQSKTSNDRYTFIKQQLSCLYYSFRLSHRPPLTNHFYQALKSLPATYDTKTKAQYNHLISNYGTHYIRQADVGGRAVDVTAVRTCRVTMDGMSMDELKDCLSLEASAAVTGKVEANVKTSACKDLSQKATEGQSFHQTFNDRSWQISGGKITFDQLSFDIKNTESATAFDTWMDSLKTNPDTISYALEPIHNLVRFKGPQKENLRKAISDYIMGKALSGNCSCPAGSVPSAGAECTCVCHGGQGGQGMSTNCCPSKRGLAKLVVTIQKATDLWGDYGSKTDAYVKYSFGVQGGQTPTIWNNNNPTWNIRFELGVVQLSSASILKVEVWDEDNRYDDDLLGSCQKPIGSGEKPELCYLQHGSVMIKVSAQCMSHLTGPSCREYVASTN
ncbi:perforin-1-like [Pseudophryne corroboree]|uniref:perforin-1-like n=1 Tax=Pseudophryne corroboree TaxID=495146 RepID=UPI003081E094